MNYTQQDAYRKIITYYIPLWNFSLRSLVYTKLRGFSSQAHYTDQATAAFQRS
jgi:hypothetical protein